MSLSFTNMAVDTEWGCTFQQVANSLGIQNINICYVKIDDILKFANQLNDTVLDSTWMTNLDHGTRRTYDYTAKETTKLLVDIFNKTSKSGTIGAEFGELMISIGSARALEKIFQHSKVPLAELWKPQAKQNEGFDFHTVCTKDFINFGEAKYSGKKDPHGLAISQARKFILEEKHFRDRAHLKDLLPKKPIENLDGDSFGVVAAFSINSKTPLKILSNALKSAKRIVTTYNISTIYLVGITD
jgi:hypothetical protein